MRFLPVLLLCVVLCESAAFAQAGSTPGGTPGVEEIMRRVAARRAEVRQAAKAFSATLHTVSVIDVHRNGSLVQLIPEGTVVHESVGNLYSDPATGAHVRIYAQRGTVLPTGIARSLTENFGSLAEYFSIDDDRIVFLNTAIASPLSDDAARYYTFELLGSATRGGAGVYEIGVHPATVTYPAFEGTIRVTREGYDVVEIDLSPSQSTAIPFVNELHVAEKFAPAEHGIYLPESIELSGTGEVNAVAFGVVQPRIAFTITSRLDDRRINVTIPDSMRLQAGRVTITDDADSVAAAYWAAHSMLTGRQAADIEQSRREHPGTLFGFSIAPYIDYNRAGATSLGLAPRVLFGPASIGGMGGYSFGLKRPIGEGTVALTVLDNAPFTATLRGGAFSQIATTTTGDKSYPRIMSTLVAATLHQDYYAFYRKDGWNAGADLAWEPLRLAVTYEMSRQSSIGNNARWSLLTWQGKEFQDNPPIEAGSYSTVQADLSWGHVAPFLKITPSDAVDVRWSLTGLLGTNRDTDSAFRLMEGLLSVSIPVVRTGYNPMTLTLLGAGGAGTASLPPQYQFRLRTSAATFGKPGGFVSPPKGLYGGTEYVSAGAEFNLTDMPWRALGLPTVNNRGVELILAGGSARYLQRHAGGYTGTGSQWYSEAGIGFSRIPLFLTDLIAGRVDLRWGLGPLGQFGANFTFVVPL